jgi:hypothetical protein
MGTYIGSIDLDKVEISWYLSGSIQMVWYEKQGPIFGVMNMSREQALEIARVLKTCVEEYDADRWNFCTEKGDVNGCR